MFEVCDLCGVLANPLRLEILAHVYCAMDGFNVGFLADEMQKYHLGLSSVSEYLMKLERIGLICRRREGRYVNYYPSSSRVPASLHGIVKLIIENLRANGSRDYARAFPILKNPFRAKVIGILSRSQTLLSTEAICIRTNHEPRHLYRDLKCAIKSGLIYADGNCIDASYSYIPPQSEIVRLMVEQIAQKIKSFTPQQESPVPRQ